MDLQGILKKTEQRSAKIKNTRPAASVAIEDRPYTNDLNPSPTAADVRPLTSVPLPAEEAGSIQIPSPAEDTLKTAHKLDTNRAQTGHKATTPSVTSKLLERETGHKPDTQPDTRLDTNWTQTGHKPDTQPNTQPDTSPSSSSSFLDLENSKTTTTGESELIADAQVQLAPEWADVDCSPLADVGFSHAHLIQLAKHGKLSAAEVASSIEFFAFDLKRNSKAKALNGSPLNFFMGILRKGVPYAPSENYESPADEARRRTREIMERKERERVTEENRIRELEFAEWRRGLSVDKLATILPDFARRPGQVQDSTLRTYFENEIWPERAQEVLGLAKLDRAEIGKQIDQAIGEVSG